MQKRKLQNDELMLLWDSLSNKFAEMNFIDRDLENKIKTVFSMAKGLNDSAIAVNILDGMLICVSDKATDSDLKDDIRGIRLYLNEIIREMENPSEK